MKVLKKFGQGNGRFSFPENGFTLALDFKATQKNLKISRMLSKVVSDFEGKVYLAKDATIDSNQFLKMINQREIRAFSEHRSNSFSSELSKRLGI